MELSEVKLNGVEWSLVESSGMDSRGVECGVEWSGVWLGVVCCVRREE